LKNQPPTTCPKLGEFDLDPAKGTFKCLDTRSLNGYCPLNSPESWEEECPYLIQDRIDMGIVPKQNLMSKATSYIKEKNPTTRKVPSEPITRAKPEVHKHEPVQTNQPVQQTQENTSQVTVKDWLLSVVGMGIHGPYVEYYYMSVQDFNTLLQALEPQQGDN